MLTTTFTAKAARKIDQASGQPIWLRTISSMPCPPDTMATREAESRVKITIGITQSATQSRSKPNHAPASRRVATAPAPIMPAAVSAAGPTKRVKIPVSGFVVDAARAVVVAGVAVAEDMGLLPSHPAAIDNEHVAMNVVGGARREKDDRAGE